MKKLLSLILTMALGYAAIGCGSGGNEPASSDSPAGNPAPTTKADSPKPGGNSGPQGAPPPMKPPGT